jgi:hypothetical protein
MRCSPKESNAVICGVSCRGTWVGLYQTARRHWPEDINVLFTALSKLSLMKMEWFRKGRLFVCVTETDSQTHSNYRPTLCRLLRTVLFTSMPLLSRRIRWLLLVTVLITDYYGYHWLMVFSDPICCNVFHWLQCLLAFLLVTMITMLLQLLSLIVVLMFLVVTTSTVVSLLVTHN